MSKGYFDNCMTTEQLEQEHKRLVIQLHPDRNTDDPEATAKFQEMQAQYEERKAELTGDYTKARKGRERREREAREKTERERKERERRKVEMAVEQARKNKQVSFHDYEEGDYIYARRVKHGEDWGDEVLDGILRAVLTDGVDDETVVMIEAVFDVFDEELLSIVFNNGFDKFDGPYGGWDVLQKPDPANGVHKTRRVAKVVMFRSEHYYMLANPMGDYSIREYYMPSMFATMFQFQLDTLIAKIAFERREQERIEAERKAKMLAEQKPLIEEWSEKLIAISAGLTDTERAMVALDNIKTMLKAKFPGTTFRQRGLYGTLSWTDGPTYAEVQKVTELFDVGCSNDYEVTPWMERFGKASVLMMDRKMSVLTKAKILQQLGSVTEAFSTSAIDDEVTVSDFDWMMLHLLVGIEVGKGQRECMSTMHADGSRSVSVLAAVRFVFERTSYVKVKTTRKSQKAQKQAA